MQRQLGMKLHGPAGSVGARVKCGQVSGNEGPGILS